MELPSSKWLLVFAHVLPLSVVKLADFITDVLVIYQLYLQGGAAWIVGVSAIAFSMFSAIALTFGSGFIAKGDVQAITPCEAIISWPLTCLHLHVPYIGLLASFNEGGTIDMGKYQLFSLLKLIGGALQSTVLAVLTAVAYLRSQGSEGNNRTTALYISSLALSFLSMVYGFYGACSACPSYTDKMKGWNGLTVALGIMVNLFWLTFSSSLCITAAPLYGYVGLICIAVAGMSQLVNILVFKMGNSLINGIGGAIAAFAPFSIVDYLIIDNFRSPERPTYFAGPSWWDKRGFPVIRRIILSAIGTVAIVSWNTTWVTIAAVTTCVVDALVSVKIFLILEEKGRSNPKSAAAPTKFSKGNKEVSLPPPWIIKAREEASDMGHLFVADMLVGIISQGVEENCDKDLKKLETFVKDILHFKIPGLVKTNEAVLSAMESAIDQYLPWEDGAHSMLLGALMEALTCEAAPAPEPTDVGIPAPILKPTGTSPPSESVTEKTVVESFVHPMRAIPLGNCLSVELWTESKFQGNNTATVQAADWALSRNVDRCDYFVSHAWADEKKYPGAKVQLLRSFLFLDYIVATLLVSSLMIGLYAASLGIGITTVAPSFPWWIFSAVVFGSMSLALGWIGISTLGIVSSPYAPWALSPTTLWLDKSCILQETPETIQAGTKSFKRFLSQCDGMIAFVSHTYFSRLWCVYELAVFCKMHEDVEERLFILSLDWQRKRFTCGGGNYQLTEAEIGVFTSFSCTNVYCSKPADRAFVLNEIRENWGSESKFDTYVREVLPDIMMRSKKKFYDQTSTVMAHVFDLSFGGA